MISGRDRTILRTLAEQHRERCDSDANQNRIAMWRDLNSMQQCRPLVHCNCGLLSGEIDAQLPEPDVEADELRWVEHGFRRMQWEQTIGDDRAFYPWLTVRAEMLTQPGGTWGIPLDRVRDETSRAQRQQLRDGLEKLRGCQVEVHMHEPMTVQNDISRISRWAEIARQEAERVAS